MQKAMDRQARNNDAYEMVQDLRLKIKHDAAEVLNSVEIEARRLVELIEEERKRKVKQLEAIVEEKTDELAKLEHCLMHYSQKLDQTVNFTRRLLDYSSVTEVSVGRNLQ